MMLSTRCIRYVKCSAVTEQIATASERIIVLENLLPDVTILSWKYDRKTNISHTEGS